MSKGQFSALLFFGATVALLTTFYTASMQSSGLLSPQGCRMSYMSPSYILQRNFNTTWTRLARRYSLWLYREVGWELILNGVPVLFIPGNAGSSRQVRSIASSATRQFYSDPYNPRRDFVSSGLKPLDFFSVDFNEDFSALHGPTLLSERSYTSSAIRFILSLYPPHTKIILMGHSMGGIVALSLLPSSDISAIITMSTPHSLPPARLDNRIEDIYSESWDAIRNDSTPILSICGGAADMLIPSETCLMERHSHASGWRKTIFTTCLEGTWTGVGHREMVWCHQVRWRVARAALELNNASDDEEKGSILRRWFHDDVDPDILSRSNTTPFLNDLPVVHIPASHRLTLRQIPSQPSIYLLPFSNVSANPRFILYVSRGTVASLSPHHTSDLHISVYTCHSTSDNCRPLQPQNLKLIPNPTSGVYFPVPGEGVDESDGVVRFETVLDNLVHPSNIEEWVGVAVRGRGDPKSWVLAGFEYDDGLQLDVNNLMTAPIWKKINIPVNPTALTASINIPNLISNSLIVYRIETPNIVGSCSAALLPPLILHRTGPAESYFHPTDGVRPILIHSHSSGPFISVDSSARHGVHVHLYSSGECGISRLEFTIDWWSSFGTWGLRYWTTVCAWAVGVVGIIIIQAWNTWEKGATFPSVSESLVQYVSQKMAPLSGVLLILSCLPLDSKYLLGNSGDPLLSPLAPLVLFITSGCVVISWTLLQGILWALLKVALIFGRLVQNRTPAVPVTEEPRGWKQHAISLGFILLLVGTVVPSQVAFLVCFFIHLFTCATQVPPSTTSLMQTDSYAQKLHILLLLFWLLPLVAPVLAVWVRTLATAGITTPFDGDHDVFAVASFLLFVDFASSSSSPILERTSTKLQRYGTLIALCALAIIPFAFGGRYTYRVYTTSNVTVGYLVLVRIGTKLWRAFR
ncbi:PGAP1-domain-containing protein [Ramaria rubella]|nr:PGAP1-domain-containing protein [Ramaria rubella]